MNNQRLKESIAHNMNHLGSLRESFFFMIDFEGEQAEVLTTEQLGGIMFDFNGVSHGQRRNMVQPLSWHATPPHKSTYEEAYAIVQHGLHRGDSYLINLTLKSMIETNYSLADLYHLAEAKYKLHVPNQFTLFSPESFVNIVDNTISSFPMKGTIKADVLGAQELLLGNDKEMAEHSTIVDLIRNDLSMVSRQVTVSKWRYLDKIESPQGALLQVSSRIDGKLKSDWRDHLGTIITTLLPAGSISGAPKKKTVDIIRKAEQRDRGWYTGICGYFDGDTLDSGVMIRMVTIEDNVKYYHSGGGITAMSDLSTEYQELQDKVYVPISGDYQNQQWSDLSTAATQ